MLAALINVPAGIGYPLLFGFVAAESAGALVPGETSLIVAGALAGQGLLSLPLVIAVAAGAAIFGDNVGYLIGRSGLRRLLDRPGRWAPNRGRLVERGEVFFARRGWAAVFFGRWLPGLRVAASWRQPDAVAWFPALERARGDRVGGHCRRARIRARSQRVGLAGCDRLRRARRGAPRLPGHPGPARSPAVAWYRLAGTRELPPRGAVDGRWP